MNPWKEAQKHFPGGVNSPVRAFKAVDGEPVFIEQGLGPYLHDTQGRRFVDYCLSWGAVLWGHADQPTVEAIRKQASKGSGFGTVTRLETALAVEIKKAFPGMEKIRFTSSGTEAVMSAVRLARGVTGRERIIKFEGCYHGHADSLLVKAGSGLATFGLPDSAGVPQGLAALTSVLPYNDLEAFKRFFGARRDVACVIVEPVAGNMGVVPADPRFLELLRKKTAETGTLLIFDEVITGFRLGYGGAQHLVGVFPDLTTLGKIIGGGLPVGAFGGSDALMRHLSPEGKVYQAGTLSGNPLSMAAGYAVLSRLSPEFYRKLEGQTRAFLKEAGKILKKGNACLSAAGSMFTLFFNQKPPKNFKEALQSDTRAFRRFFQSLLKRGVYWPPSAFESCFVSASHGRSEFEKTLKAMLSYR